MLQKSEPRAFYVEVENFYCLLALFHWVVLLHIVTNYSCTAGIFSERICDSWANFALPMLICSAVYTEQSHDLNALTLLFFPLQQLQTVLWFCINCNTSDVKLQSGSQMYMLLYSKKQFLLRKQTHFNSQPLLTLMSSGARQKASKSHWMLVL